MASVVREPIPPFPHPHAGGGTSGDYRVLSIYFLHEWSAMVEGFTLYFDGQLFTFEIVFEGSMMGFISRCK
jgi:hypothetical protein